jgi:hypothetical protein
MKPPVCRHLRTKKMFIPVQAGDSPGGAEESAEQNTHFWCNLTLTEVGFDDEPVGSQRCHAPRPCFEE